jgi:hypothetical protein
MTILNFGDGQHGQQHKVYDKLSPFSTEFPLTIENISYPSILHAVLLPFLSDPHQRSILLSMKNIPAMMTQFNEWERKQFEEMTSTILRQGYEHILYDTGHVKVYHMGHVIETLYHSKIPKERLDEYMISSSQLFLKPILRDLLNQIKGKSIYFHEMWDPLEILGLNGTKTPLEGMNIVGRTLQSLIFKNRHSSQYESRQDEIYFIHALIQFYQHLLLQSNNSNNSNHERKALVMLWDFVGKTVQDIYEQVPEFREFLAHHVSFSLLDSTQKETIVRSFLSHSHPDSYLIEMECEFPGNLSIFFMKKYMPQYQLKLDQEWSSAILSEFSLSITEDFFPSSSYMTTMENIMSLTLAQRTLLYDKIVRLYEEGKWTSEKVVILHQQRMEMLETVHRLSKITNPKVYHFVQPCISIGDELSNVKKNIFTDNFPLSSLTYLLDYRTFLLFSSKVVKSCPISFFFPSLFHYLYFRLFLVYSSISQEDEMNSLYIKLYSKIWKEGVLPDQVEKSLLTQHLVPEKYQDPDYFVDSQTSHGHTILFSYLQILILDKKKQILQSAIQTRVEQHPYLVDLLLSTSLLGWTEFRYQSSVKDTFLGYDSHEKEEDFFLWQYHNVLGKTTEEVRQKLLQTHAQEKNQMESISKYVHIEKYSFDIFHSQFERMKMYMKKIQEFQHVVMTPRIMLQDAMTFTSSFFPSLFISETKEAKEAKEEMKSAWSMSSFLSPDAEDYVADVWIHFWKGFGKTSILIPKQPISVPSTHNKEELLNFWIFWWASFLSSMEHDLKKIGTKTVLQHVLTLLFPNSKMKVPTGLVEIEPKECDEEKLNTKISKMKTEHTADEFVCIKGKWMLKTSETAKRFEKSGPPDDTVIYLYSPLFTNSSTMQKQLQETFPFVKEKALLSRLSFVLYYCVIQSIESIE